MPTGKLEPLRAAIETWWPLRPIPGLAALAMGLWTFWLYGGLRTGMWCGFEPGRAAIFMAMVFCLFGIPPTLVISFAAQAMSRRRFRNQPEGQVCCANCGYLLEGIPGNTCPECGKTRPELNVRQPARTLGQWYVPMILACLIGVLVGEGWAAADDVWFKREVRAGLHAVPGSTPVYYHRERWWPFTANGVYFNGEFGAHD